MTVMIRADIVIMAVMTVTTGRVIAKVLWWGTEKNQ